jgi:hypothetical protein
MLIRVCWGFHHNSTHIEAYYIASSLEIMVIVSWGTLGGYEKGKKVFYFRGKDFVHDKDLRFIHFVAH